LVLFLLNTPGYPKDEPFDLIHCSLFLVSTIYIVFCIVGCLIWLVGLSATLRSVAQACAVVLNCISWSMCLRMITQS